MYFKHKIKRLLNCVCFIVITLQFITLNSSQSLTTDSLDLNYLPDCSAKEDNIKDLFIFITLDGKISTLETTTGTLKWSKEINSGPLLSSTIADVMLDGKGERVQLVPSLRGDLYAYNLQQQKMQRTQFSTKKLLKNSHLFNENVLLVGGQENKILGLDLNDGSVLYECGFKDCFQNENLTYDDMILLKTTSQSIRAINSLNGKEEWHFVVSDPQLSRLVNQHCHNNLENNNPYTVSFKVNVPTGSIYSSVYHSNDSLKSQLFKSWNYKFDSPIVNMWHYENDKLISVNLFDSTKIDLNHNLLSSENMKNPQVYIGVYNNQFYIQQSNEISNLATNDDNDKHVAILEWNTPVNVNGNTSNTYELISKPSTLASNSTAYYFFNYSISYDKCKKIDLPSDLSNITAENTIYEIAHTSLSYYWKEIVVICVSSWIFFNFLSSIFKKYFCKILSKSIVEKNVKAEINKDETVKENTFYSSRYLQDFEQLNLLGKGGFGLVFEAKHKIDESLYAVKRIAIPSDGEKRNKFMREIRALSKLDHIGIVRYYNAWVEEPPAGWQEDKDKHQNYDMTETFVEMSPLTESSSLLNYNNQKLTETNLSFNCAARDNQSQDSLEIVFENNSNQSSIKMVTEDSLIINYDSYSNSDNNASYSLKETNISMNETKPNSILSEKKKQTAKVYVYIQMQLCKKETLRDWIFNNKVRDKTEIFKIFVQIIDAVNYVHSNNLIHRDLKPSNIFFSMNGQIKIGDFGLVTDTFENNNCDEEADSPRHPKHTNHVGTQLYMSPEQIRNRPYDHKVDIYSMGIILYELLTSFDTMMERTKKLEDARNRKFPNEFIEKNQREILNKLLSLNPNERPEAIELLEYLKEYIEVDNNS